jgi:alpha-N-arabinofuranosidase
VKTGKQLSEIRRLWTGLGGRYPEGPHLYKKDGYYYLMLAEGGTEHGHFVTIARSRYLEGPYEPNPSNPILTHFSMKMQNSPIQGLGHADLVQAPDGSWWMICLGYRTHGYLQHVMGRETFLAPVTWEDGGWPIVNRDGTLQLDMKCKTLPQVSMPMEPKKDEFESEKLSLYWSFLNMPQKENYSLDARSGWLRMKTSTITLDEVGNPTFIGHRQSEKDFTATTKVDVSGLKDGGVAGITAYAAHHNHYDVQVVARDGKRYVQAKIRIGEMEHIEKEILLTANIVYLRITADSQFYHLYYSTDNKDFVHLARQDYRYLSTETIGGFCGVHIGIFAHTLNKTQSYADFDWTDFNFKAQ